MPIALALSPHLDDAAFSAGATLAALARRGWRVVVATLFTGNVPSPQGFALECQTSKGIGAEVDYMALRRAEDARACAALGAEPVHLALLEAPHRGYKDAAALFGPVQADDPARDHVDSAIGRLVSDVRPDLILAPQAIGAHVDHVVVHQAVAAGTFSPVWYWRDWPYSWRDADRDPFAPRMRTLPTIAPDSDMTDHAAKRTAAHAYASQLGFQFGGPERLDRALENEGPEIFRIDERHAAVPRASTGAGAR